MKNKFCGLSGNVLKILACLFMLVDHMGLILFPDVIVFRIIGRLSFPIFAFLVYEGARHTKNKFKHLILVMFLGIIYTIVFYLMNGDIFLNIFLTFTFSIIIIFCLDFIKENIKKWWSYIFITLLTVFIAGLYIMAKYIVIDYGFWGIMLSVFPYIADLIGKKEIKTNLLFTWQFAFFVIGLILLCVFLSIIQVYCIPALILLAMYNGKIGFKLNKYFFYIFYPAHLVILWAIKLIV